MIGLLGATGAVGRTAAQRIAAFGLGPLRVGGRNVAAAADVAASLPGPAHAVRVDLHDPAELAAFCDGCRIVVSCAGPTYRVLDTVARAAFAAGADYVDIGGELAAKDALTGHPLAGDRIAVFSAGVMPGLSGLLPRLLAKGRAPRRLDVYVGGAAVFTPLSAVDALLTRGPRFGAPMAAWRGGRVEPNALAPLHGVRLPGFPVPVHAWPYLTTEAQTLAADTRADEVRCYNVFVSGRLPEALAAAWAEADGADPAALAGSVVRASLADNADFGAFYVMLFTARPRPGEPPGPGRIVLTAVDSYALSGVVMALAARAVLTGSVPPGVHLAAEVLDPDATAAELRDDPLVEDFVVS
ncbi:saccharopine dehydrogenase NADP-binding domain-containing protein [Nonomuraea sp. ATR24]|uniref:saccharopine dehydrogenase NADP-binding domain-containing protein n=1 Tax=Nonomuraea sp. ATR24 TaxID=1676744 RepID=UPI0035C1AA74